MPLDIKIESTKIPDVRRFINQALDPKAISPLVKIHADIMARRMSEITPVNKDATAVSRGNLKSSWTGEVLVQGDKVIGNVLNTDPRVRKGLLNLLLYGSRAHSIVPHQKKALHFFSQGEEFFRANVKKHPGTLPNLDFRIGMRRIIKEGADNLKKSIMEMLRAKQSD